MTGRTAATAVGLPAAERVMSSTTGTRSRAGAHPGRAGTSDTAAGSGWSGSRATNSAPRPGPSLRASTVPPCSSTRLFTTASPSPNPPLLRSRLVSAWVSASNSRGRRSGPIPTPVSRTVSSACRRPGSAATRTPPSRPGP
jgi:hypothetical protein